MPLGPHVRHTEEQRLDPLRLRVPEPAEAGAYAVRDPGGDVEVAYARDGHRLDVEIVGAPGEVSLDVRGRTVRDQTPSSDADPDGRRRLAIALRIDVKT